MITKFPKIALFAAFVLGFVLKGLSLTIQDVQNMPPNSWLTIPNTQLQLSPVAAPNYLSATDFAKIRGNTGFSSVMIAWSGGALDTKRNQMLIWGGGHADYYGNEIYAFDMNTLQWKRLTNPCLNPSIGSQGSLGIIANADGSPMIQHTYGVISYLSHSDRFFYHGLATWAFDFTTLQWTNKNTANYPTDYHSCSVYDPQSKRVWYGCTSAGLFSYNDSTNIWIKHNTNDNWYYHTMVYDTKRGNIVVVGQNDLIAYNVSAGNYTKQVWNSTGTNDIVSASNPGFDYDPTSDQLVGWNGTAVCALNPETKVWTSYNPAGAPSRTANGIYGRWRYVPAVNAFVCITNINEDVHFYKLTAGPGTAVERGSVSNSKKALDLRISPNPVTAGSVIRFGSAKISSLRIYDVQGKMVRELSGSTGMGWQTKALSTGVYVVKWTDKNNNRGQQKLAVVGN
jgi:hypothetical protein